MDEVILKGLESAVLGKLKKFSDVPPNYQFTVKIFRVFSIRLEDRDKLAEHISCGLKRLGYPAYYAYFYGVGYRPVRGVQEWFECFCTYLAFTVVDPARRIKCTKFFCCDKEYKGDPYIGLYLGCINMLNEIALLIFRFTFKMRVSDMGEAEIIARFFRGDFFSVVDKDVLITARCAADNRKYLLIETAVCFFQILKYPESLLRAYKMCSNLLEKVKDILFFEERLQEENKKERLSKGGSKRFSKYDATIPNDKKEEIYQEYKNKHPEMIKKYKNGENKRMVISSFHTFFRLCVIQEGNRLKIPRRTTLNWVVELLESHIND